MSCKLPINFSTIHNQSNFSDDQLIDYLANYNSVNCLLVILNEVRFMGFFLNGCIGFISYTVMIAALQKISISRCTLIYYRAMAIMEIIQMCVMIPSGITRYIGINALDNWYWVCWTSQLTNGWDIGDTFKLSISTLTLFITLERYIAVCHPSQFPRINKKSVAHYAIILSIFNGTAHLWVTAGRRIDFDPGQKIYVMSTAWLAAQDFINFTQNWVYVARVLLCLPIFVLSLITIVRLRKEAMNKFLLTGTAKNDWTAKRRMCMLAFITGASTFVDHIIWAINRSLQLWLRLPTVGLVALTTLSYDDAMVNFKIWRLTNATQFIQAMCGQFLHSWRFIIFLALNKTMSEGVRKLFRNDSANNQVTNVRSVSTMYNNEGIH